MINTNYITMLVTFTNTSDSMIFNTSLESLQKLAHTIEYRDLTLDTVKVFDRATGRFKRAARAKVLVWCDHCTELDLILEKQRF
jgi:hypothetical protein